MQSRRDFPEVNLSKDKIINRVKFYSWPYSQPKIVNTVRASSRMGLLLGFLTIPLVTSGLYFTNNALFIDFLLLLSLLTLKVGIIPGIRRNKIKYTPSEARKLNYYGLLISSMILHSSIVRVIFSIGLYFVKRFKNFNILNNLLEILRLSMIDIKFSTVIIGLALASLPIILMLYPRDIKVSDYHYRLLELQRSTYEVSGFKEEKREQIPLFPNHFPQTITRSEPIVSNTPSNNNNHQNRNKTKNRNNNSNNKPHTNQNNTVVESDIWESKISRRQRRE
jgi:hypothetical protein